MSGCSTSSWTTSGPTLRWIRPFPRRRASAKGVARFASDGRNARGAEPRPLECAREGARTGSDLRPRRARGGAGQLAREGVSSSWRCRGSRCAARPVPHRLRLDVRVWMRSVAACLRESGRLVLIDLHPLVQTVGSVEPLLLDFPCAFDSPHRFDEPGSYADAAADVSDTVTVEYGHSLGEIVTAAICAGLRIDESREHMDLAIDPRGDVLARENDGRYRLRIGGMVLPVLYTLLATRVLSWPGDLGAGSRCRRARRDRHPPRQGGVSAGGPHEAGPDPVLPGDSRRRPARCRRTTDDPQAVQPGNRRGSVLSKAGAEEPAALGRGRPAAATAPVASPTKWCLAVRPTWRTS